MFMHYFETYFCVSFHVELSVMLLPVTECNVQLLSTDHLPLMINLITHCSPFNHPLFTFQVSDIATRVSVLTYLLAVTRNIVATLVHFQHYEMFLNIPFVDNLL